MDKSKLSAWQEFEKTGSIKAYLNFKAYEKNHLNFEAGEDFGVNKDVRACDTGSQIRRDR